MSAFALHLPTRIAFGPGSAQALRAEASRFGPRALVVTGSDPGRVAHLLEGLGPHHTVTVSGEPTLDDARRARDEAVTFATDVVLAIGGGSVIDLAKAVAMLLGNGGDPLDYLEVIGRGMPITQPSLPLIAVPTTSGTGAEVTANAVLADRDQGVKASLRSPGMVPRLALVDPELTLGCPPSVTASAGMDALTQCLEPYLCPQANPVTDGWARTGLIAAGRSLRTAYRNGEDLAARTDMALASLLGGLALANAKLGAVHGFAGAIGGMADAPHGAVCAALLAPVCRANLAEADAALASRFDDVARWLTDDPAASAEAGIDWIEETVELLDVPGLGAYGLTSAQTEVVVSKAAASSSMKGNPVPLSLDTLSRIYRSAL